MPIKELLNKLFAQFLALPQWMQALLGAIVVGLVVVLLPSGNAAVVPQPSVAPPSAKAAPTIPAVVASPTNAQTIDQMPNIKIADKSQVPVGTTAITKLKLVKALPVGAVTSLDLQNQLKTDYQARLSFPLTEEKMVRFAEAALQVESTNRRWDVQIAGAENDAMAIEYLKMSRNESVKALETVQGITMPEYVEIFNLTAQDDRFNQIAIAYKDLVAAEQKRQAKLQTQELEQAEEKSVQDLPASPAAVAPATVVSPPTAPQNSPQP